MGKIGYKEVSAIAGEYQINFKGIHNHEILYKTMYEWLTDRGFMSTAAGDPNIEDFYSETILPGGSAKNIWYYWRTTRKESDMYHYHIDIDMQVLVMSNTEIIHKDKKVKMHNGEFMLTLRAYYIVDPDKMWNNNWITSFLSEWLWRKKYIEQIDSHKGYLYNLATDLFENIKQQIGLLTIKPMGPSFRPEKGVPQIEGIE